MSALALGLGLPAGAGAVRDPDAAAIMAAMAVPPGEVRAGQVDRLVTALKGCGVWQKLDSLFVFAAHNEQAARIDWKQPARVAVAHGDPVFEPDRGWAFDGTAYVDTGFNPYMHGVNLTGTAGAHGVYESSDRAVSLNAYAATSNSTRNISMIPRNGNGFTQAALNHAGSAGAAPVSDSLGLVAYQRDGAVGQVFKRGALASTNTLTTAGSVPVDLSVYIGCRNADGIADNFRESAAALWFAGGVLSEGQHLGLENAVQCYMTDLGAAV